MPSVPTSSTTLVGTKTHGLPHRSYTLAVVSQLMACIMECCSLMRVSISSSAGS